MSRILLIASCLLVSLHASVTLCAVDYPSSPYLVGERYPTNPTNISVALPTVSDANNLQNLTSHEIVTPPTKGTFGALVGTPLNYIPRDYEDGNDTFVWKAINDTTGLEETYTGVITISSVNNPPQIAAIAGNAFSFQENQAIVGSVTIFDPDSTPTSGTDLLRLDVNGTDSIKFTSTYLSSSGDNHVFQISYTPSSQPNYEALYSGGDPTFSIDLNATDRDATGAIVNQAGLQTISIILTDQQESPTIVSTENPIARSINEDEDTSTKLGFTPMEIAADDPESVTNANNKISWSYTSNNPILAGVVKLNGVSLAAGGTSASFDSGSLVEVDYVPATNAYGTEILTFYAKDATGRTSVTPVTITMTVAAVNDDVISLNEATSLSLNFLEEGTGVIKDFNPTDPDSDADPANRPDNNTSSTPGVEIYYALSGLDADKFEISSTGQLTFKSAPDYETPLDLGGVVGDNVYELTVQVRDSASPPYTSDSQTVIVTVDPKNELPTLSGGLYTYDILINEDSTWTWNSGLIDLNATDVDAGHQSILDWRIKSGSNGIFGTASATGTGGFPSSLSYVPDLDYAGDGNASSPDDTFVVEIYDGVASTEITFRVFITAVSDPPRITNISPSPLESIAVTRDRYTINLNENNPSTVRIEFMEPDGDGIGNVEILNESLDKVKFSGSPYWSPGATYADLSFSSLHLPNFEDNQSSDGDGNYSLVVRVSDNEGTPKYQNLYLDFIIQNVDEPPAFAPEVDFNQTALENQTHAATLTAVDPEGVSSFHWQIIYGYDSPKFQLSASSGPSVNLSFVVPPNFEVPLDDATYGDKNNTYAVRIMVSDASSGGKSTTQTFVINVADDNDFPLISPTPLNIDEPLRTNAMMNLGQYASDEDNQSGAGADSLTWAELSGDTTSFALDQNGTLRFNQDSDFETNSSFSIEVRVSDGRGGFFDANFTVEVNAQNEAPEFFESNTSNLKVSFVQFNLTEDSSVSGNLSDYARDPETGNSVGLTFGENFTDYNGTNDSNGTLVLNQLSGAFIFTPKANYSGLTYVDFTVSDGLLTGVLPIVFSVSDIPDAPVVREGNNSTEITSLLTKAIIEGNSTFGIEFNATDPNDTPSSTTFIWSLQGADATKFKIEPNPGPYVTLSLLQVPDFENPHDSGTDNRFDLNVTVTDGGNSAYTFPVQINILDGSEPPYFDYTSGWDGNTTNSFGGSPVMFKQAVGFVEGGTGFVFDVNASDLDNSPIIYGLTNPSTNGVSLDNSLFTINSSTGRISFASTPDFENLNPQAKPIPQSNSNFFGTPISNVDINSTYVIEVNATDDIANSDKIRHYVYVTIGNVVEPPYFDDGSSRAVDWNETTTTILDVNRTDTDDANKNLLLEISGGLDQSLFSLNVATGMLSFIAQPDYENPNSSDGDNAYEVQIRIQGTSVTQDLTLNVKEENDAPVITSTALTQLTVNENQPFVIDLDVSDQDSGPEYLDILFTKDSNSTRFASHTGNASSIGSLFPAISSGMVDNHLGSASYSVAGDLDNDGDFDVVCLERSLHTLHYLENSGTGSFTRKSPNPFSLDGNGKYLDHAVITDFDQDGDKDVVLSYFGDGASGGARMSWLKNNGSGVFDPEQEIFSRTPAVGTDIDYFAIGDLDGDSYPDLVVAFRGSDSVDWYKNDGAQSPSYTWKGQIMSSADGLDAPRSLELVDIDNSGSLDVIISANQNLYLAINDGFETIFNHSTLTSFTGASLVAKAQDVTLDGLIDIVFATSMGAPGVIVQNSTGFDAPISLPTHADPLKAVAYPTDIAILPSTLNTRLSILVSDSSIHYISLFEAKSSLDGQFDQPIHVNTGLGVTNMALVDLNRKPDALFYSFVGGEDQNDFNATRFMNDGKLFFNFSPDFENPKDETQINRYDVIVKVTDSQGGETVESVAVSINEINEAPVITSLDGNRSATYVHNEGNLTTLFDVTAINDESTVQSLTYSLSGGADESNFTIDSATGRLTFRNAPDFEIPSDSNKDNVYVVLVRVTDNGPGSPYDEQNVSVSVVDGFEPPKFDGTVVTSHAINEDNAMSPLLLTATDQNLGGTIASYSILTNGANGTATVSNNAGPPVTATLSYVPDGNFTGSDTVVVEVTNDSGLSTPLSVSIQVNSINDAPSILTPFDLNHSENQQQVAMLSAVDDSNTTVVWSWADGTVNDADFLLTAGGELSFRINSGPDYEDPNQGKVFSRMIRVTDPDGNYTEGNFTITVINLNDNQPLSPHLVSNASSSFSLVENTTTIVDLNVTDADNGVVYNFNVVSYSITGGPDRTRFSISNSGRLSLLPAPDFENPNSADLDNIYQADLTLSDGGYTQIYPIVVTVTDADENPPVITSDGGGADANFSLPENTLIVTQVMASDVENSSFTFSISGGADQNLFDVNSSTGLLTFVNGPDFESKSDSDKNDLYEVWVKVSDGLTYDEQRMNIRIYDVNEPPTVSPASLSTMEDVPIVVTFTVSDPEGLLSDSSLLSPPEHGELAWSTYPLTTSSDQKFTYTPSPNYSGTDRLVLRVTDGTKQDDITIPIEINATNDPPSAVDDEVVYDDPLYAPLFVDVMANDSNAPDANGTELILVDSWGQPLHGTLTTTPNSMLASYQPVSNFIGVDSFNYVLTDGVFYSTATVNVIVKRASGFPSWRFLNKVGYYNLSANKWVYHADLGWLYIENPDGLETVTWVWHEDIGWFWTGDQYAPNAYLSDLSGWFAFAVKAADTNIPKQYMTWPIYDQRRKEWLSSENLKILRVNTKLAKYTSVDAVIGFVENSDLFTPQQKKDIKTELFFTGTSSTMKSMGFTFGN